MTPQGNEETQSPIEPPTSIAQSPQSPIAQSPQVRVTKNPRKVAAGRKGASSKEGKTNTRFKY